jgi:hypothetical protein
MVNIIGSLRSRPAGYVLGRGYCAAYRPGSARSRLRRARRRLVLQRLGGGHRACPRRPLSLQDSSTVLLVEENRRLKLTAGLWPLGEATVDIRLEPVGTTYTRVTIEESFERGPLHWAQNKINDLVLHRRNIESLRRLADIAERAVPKAL